MRFRCGLLVPGLLLLSPGGDLARPGPACPGDVRQRTAEPVASMLTATIDGRVAALTLDPDGGCR